MLSVALMGAVSSCSVVQAIEMKKFRVYNMSNRSINIIECKGIDLFHDSRNNLIIGPYKPDLSTTIATWGPVINIEYPVTVKWAYTSQPSDIKEIQFDQLMNLPKGRKEIRGEGSINLVFYKGQFFLIWVANQSNLYPDDYKKILKMN